MARCRAHALLLGLLLLASCRPAETPEEPTTPQWATYPTAAEALPSAATHRVTGSVPGTSKQPVLYVGSTTDPGAPEQATVWLPGKGRSPGRPVRLELSGDSRVEAVGTNGDTTVVVGHQWQEGRETPFAMVSRDRRAWDPIPITVDLHERSIVLHRVAVTRTGEAVALGVDRDRDIAIALDLADQRIVDLPGPAAMVPEAVRAVVRVDDRMLALVRMTTEDGSSTVLGYQSNADATSWALSGPLPGEDTEVNGAIIAPYGVVAAGSRRVGGVQRPAIWRWLDGYGWEASDTVDMDLSEGSDAAFGAPVTLGKDVVIPVLRADATRTPLMIWTWRSGLPQWFWPTSLPRWNGPNPDVRLERDGQRVRAVRSGWGRTEVGRFDLDDLEWTSLARSEPAVVPVQDWSSVTLDGDVPLLIGTRQRSQTTATGWRTGPHESAYGLDSGSLARTSWDPRQGKDLAMRALQTGTDGTTVLLGVAEVGEQQGWTDVRGWVRPPGGDWQEATGLDGPRSEQLSALLAVEDGWLAVGVDSDGLAQGRAEQVAVWRSADGRQWQRADGPRLGKGFEQMRATAACIVDDAVVLVGWGRRGDGGEVPLVLRGKGEKWTRVEPTGLDGTVTRLTGCAADGETLLVRGSGATSHLWRSTDGGRGFDEVSPEASHDRIGTVIAVDGGFLAGGERHGHGLAGPVVWLSSDGATWTAVPVVGTTRQQVSQLMVHREGLVVAMVGTSGPEVVTLTNWAELLAQV